MKNLILIAALFLSLGATAQTVKQDAAGNNYAVKSDSTSKPTGKTFTDSKGVKYPVMLSKTGKLFYVRTSKSGNTYNSYIKL